MLQLHCEDEGYVAYAPPGFKADVQVLPSLSCWKPAAASASVHVLTTVKGHVAALMKSMNLSAKERAAGATRAMGLKKLVGGSAALALGCSFLLKGRARWWRCCERARRGG